MAKPVQPPGQRLVKRMSARTRWRILLPLSLLLISGGLWVLGEATSLRQAGVPFRQWFLWGMYALSLINGGLVLFVQAIRYRLLVDYRRFLRRELKKNGRL